MSGRKSLYLILALVLPVGIFLFLKFFGKNEFEVEPLFQDAVPVSAECGHEYVFPYVIPDSVAQQLKINEHELTLVVFGMEGAHEEIESQVVRIEEEFSADPIEVEWLMDNDTRTNFHFIKRCVFLMDDPLTLALVDNAGRIRGQYDVSSLDEMDRLIVEMKIILKKY